MLDEKGPGVGAPRPGRKLNVDGAKYSGGRRDLPPKFYVVPPMPRPAVERAAPRRPRPAILIDPASARVWLGLDDDVVGVELALRLPSGDALFVDDDERRHRRAGAAFSLYGHWPYFGPGAVISTKRHGRLATTVAEVERAVRWFDNAAVWIERQRLVATGKVVAA